MIRRLAILCWKDLAASRAVLLAALLVLCVLGVIAWLGQEADPVSTSRVDGVRAVLLFFIPAAGLMLGHRLVVREYQAHTQLFLEALPLRRLEVVLAKYALGAFLLCGASTAFLLAWMALVVGDGTPRFLSILTLRICGFSVAAWSLFFGFGMLGRLRVAAYLTLGCGVFLLERTTAFELDRFGPIALVAPDSFAYERVVLPVRNLLESAALSAGFAALGASLALVSEGSLAERLTRRASAREIVALSVLAIAELWAVTWAGSKIPTDPFEFAGSAVARSRSGRAEVMYGFSNLEPAGTRVLSALEQLQARLQRELGVSDTPALRVAHDSLLEPNDVRHATARHTSGVLLEVNLAATDLDLQNLLQNAAHGSFSELSGGRAAHEPNHWLLDGFSAFWTSEGHPEAAERHWLRAIVAERSLAGDARSLSYWERVMELVGETSANAVAMTLVHVLDARSGRRETLELARSVLARETVTNAATWLTEGSQRLEARLLAATGESFPELTARWRAELRERSRREPWAGRLARIPADAAAARVEASRIGVDIVYRFDGPPLERERSCSVHWSRIAPYDSYVPTELMKREAVRWTAGQARVTGRIKGALQRGQRALVALECEVPELRSNRRLRAARFEAL